MAGPSPSPAVRDGLLKMSALAERAGVSPATVKHYLREGLLEPGPGEPAVVRTSRNMAWYPEAFVDRIALVKRLQEERFMPLRAIRELLAEPGGPARAREIVARGDAILDRVRSRPDGREELEVVTREELVARTGAPEPLLDKFAELGVLGDGTEGYDPDEARIVASIMRFRGTGFGVEVGFTAYDVVRYLDALRPLVREEAATFVDRLVDQEIDPDRAADLILGGIDPLRELVGAIHGRLLRLELDRGRTTPRPRGGRDAA